MATTIDNMQSSHWHKVQDIYKEGIATGNATFETKVPDWNEWNESYLTERRSQIVG